MRRFLWLALRLIILGACTGCAANTVGVGTDNLRVRTGQWLGYNAEGSVMLEFSIVSAGDAGANIVLLTYAYPCADQSISFSSFNLADMEAPRPIQKAEIHDGVFDMRVEQTDPISAQVFTPFAFAGKISDPTHIDGTWEVFKHRVLASEAACPATKGTWEGRPK